MATVSYPKWKYHWKDAAVIIHTADQEKLLGPDWKDSPADCVKPQAPQAKAKK